MAPRKLSEADKQAVIEAYRQSGDTAATLASRYGVSNSTISRILKQSLPEAEYEILVQQRRSGARGEEVAETENLLEESPAIATAAKPVVEPPAPRRQRQRSTVQLAQSAPAQDPDDSPLPAPQMAQLELRAVITQPIDEPVQKIESRALESKALEGSNPANPVVKGIAASIKLKNAAPEPLSNDYESLIGEDLEEALEEDEDDLDDDLDGDLDGDLGDDELDDDLEEDETADAIGSFGGVQIAQGKRLQVLPLSEANLPRTCYVVVDRASELITRPLKDFAELGQIPDGEIQAKTLPIFDNHRIAKRFLRRMQRVVKVPDGRVLQKVRPYLQAKGITRLLIDGQIYSV
jgi:transposase-like protein